MLDIERCAAPDRRAGVEFYGGMLLPGMINVHCHLELSYLRGAIAQGGGFAAFARSMGEVRGRCTGQERETAAAAADARMYVSGIEAVGDVANGGEAFAVKARSRIRYRTFAEVFGLRCTTAEGQRPLLRHPRTSLTPHSIYSVQDALFREICAEGDAPLSIHFEETPAEAELFARQGALWEWYGRAGFTCDFLGYGSPARRLVESVPPHRSVILVHNCCITQKDIELIEGHFTTPVRWCLCPGSNHYISRLKPPVALLRRHGAHICLGTDSLASNTGLSLLDEMRLLADQAPLEELLRWATSNGAEALGFDDLGTIAPGRRPGLLLLSGLDWPRRALTPQTTLRRLL